MMEKLNDEERGAFVSAIRESEMFEDGFVGGSSGYFGGHDNKIEDRESPVESYGSDVNEEEEEEEEEEIF